MSALDNEIRDVEAKLADQKSLGTECEVYSRISGYYRSIKNWNPGKGIHGEFGERKMYKITSE